MKREEVLNQVERRNRAIPPFREEIHPSALKFIAQKYFVLLVENVVKGRSDDHAHILTKNIEIISNLDTRINKKKYVKITNQLNQSAHFSAIPLLHYFYNIKTPPPTWMFFQDISRVTFGYFRIPVTHLHNNSHNDFSLNLLTDLFYDAIGLGFKSLEHQYRTTDVTLIVRNIRQSGDFSLMPILADALQDAGFHEEDVLRNYRNPTARFSFGSWIFRATGFNCKVKQEVSSPPT